VANTMLIKKAELNEARFLLLLQLIASSENRYTVGGREKRKIFLQKLTADYFESKQDSNSKSENLRFAVTLEVRADAPDYRKVLDEAQAVLND
jgi:hypothetical protein